MNNELQQRFALYSDLHYQVARRFADRPTFFDAASWILRDQWPRYRLNAKLDPASLTLSSNPLRPWSRPLPQVLIERFCQQQNLHLTPEDDQLSSPHAKDQAELEDFDLLPLERLLNEVAPLLLDTYQQLLVAYWSQANRRGETPWQWLSQYLQDLFKAAIEDHQQKASLPSFALAAAQLVQAYPGADQRAAWPNSASLKVSLLNVDFSPDGALEVDLGSAMLIEREASDHGPALTLLFSLQGKLYDFSSRQSLLQDIELSWPITSRIAPHTVTITPSTDQVFEAQALVVLEQQLRLIKQLAGKPQSWRGALALSRVLDQVTSMIDLSGSAETQRDVALSAKLPDWLREADGKSLLHYSSLLIDIAQDYRNVEGRFWLDGIETAEAFANRLVAARFAKDHPGAILDPARIQVLNLQTTATASAHEGVVVSGEITPVTFTLAQLAIGNLGLLKPGSIKISSTDASTLPDWMSETYLRSVIRELDVASAYPAMLRRSLLQDPAQRERRQQLLTSQLRSQLPAQGLELYLRGELADRNSVEYLTRLFYTDAVEGETRWVMRPLGLIKSVGATPDHPYNTWLVEIEAGSSGPLLLYRPMHEHPLLQFADRMALWVAISEPGALQDDLLQRLAPEVRRVYNHGGFLEPHLFRPFDDTSAVPFGKPAPVALSVESPVTDIGAALYEACIEESIQHFKAHSATSAETRQAQWKTLGWLLFNTLLPIAGRTVNALGWLVQMEVALAEFVDSDNQDNPVDHRLALVNLLINIAVLMFSHSLFRIHLEENERLSPPPKFNGVSSPVEPAKPPLPEVIALKHHQVLPGWSQPSLALSAGQRTALQAMRAIIQPAELGSPIPHGPLEGLYLHHDVLHVMIDDQVYPVRIDAQTDRPRVIDHKGEPGPWLQRDEAGRWQLDLRLRLRGGMPLGKRLQLARAAKQEERRTLNEKVKDATSNWTRKTEEMSRGLLAMQAEDPQTLRDTLLTMQALAQYWETYLGDLERLDLLEGGSKNFKANRTKLLYQAAMARQSVHTGLLKLYNAPHEQLMDLRLNQAQGQELTAADISSANQRLDDIIPWLDQMIENSRKLGEHQVQFGMLRSPANEELNRWFRSITRIQVTRRSPITLRFMRLDAFYSRLQLAGLPDMANYLAERLWDNVHLAIGQRQKYLGLDKASDEARSRLLHGMAEQFVGVRRQLDTLGQWSADDAMQQVLERMRQDLTFITTGVEEELKALPDYPSRQTLEQLRQELPGLIETTDEGLLLGEPDAGGSTTVTIGGAGDGAVERIYQQEETGWQPDSSPVDPVAKPTLSERSLKRLLKESPRVIRDTQAEVQRLERQLTGSFLPVEIEEMINRLRGKVLAQIEAIQTRLTADNATDEATHGQDAATTVNALVQVAQSLEGRGAQLRTQAALLQPPRMGELQRLIDLNVVQIETPGPRARLARVKGRPADFLDEYAIHHQGTVKWYAHFHYPAPETLKPWFTAGHLKTREQRMDRGNVYRHPITLANAQRYFFDRPE